MGEFGTLVDAQIRPKEGRPRGGRVQAGRRGVAAMPAWLVLLLGLAGCSQNPVLTPVAWWHDLQGGAIAADRPPPPGADQPYPHIYNIPPKPVLPSASFRDTVLTRLAQERDDTERQAAHDPIVVVPVPAPPAPLPAPPAGMEGADSTTANATMPAADAPPAPAVKARRGAPPVVAASDGGPAAGAKLVLAGGPADEANLPNVPDAPPAPATFEGVAAQPEPTPPPPLPAHVARGAAGAAILFRPDDAVLDGTQTLTIKDAASHRGKGSIDVEGHGDAQSGLARFAGGGTGPGVEAGASGGGGAGGAACAGRRDQDCGDRFWAGGCGSGRAVRGR